MSSRIEVSFPWNGLFAFWIPGAAFGGWYIAMTLMMLRAIKRPDQETV